jgi:Protein of unknown function (DUF524).
MLPINSKSDDEWEISDEFKIIENGWYQIEVIINSDRLITENVELLLNGITIGKGVLKSKVYQSQYIFDIIFDSNSKLIAQPFLLQYDLIKLTIKIEDEIESFIEFSSDYILCLSKDSFDVENISTIIEELLDFSDEDINKWIFSTNQNKASKIGLIEGSWKENSYKSLNSYLQLMEEIYVGYRNNLLFFKNQSKHTITRTSTLKTYQNIRSISINDFEWLMRNSDQLTQTNYKTAITYERNYYLPIRMRTEEFVKSLDVYENQIVISFLSMVCNCIQMIVGEYQKEITNEQLILEKLKLLEFQGFKAPIITIKRIQINNTKTLLNKFEQLCIQFFKMFSLYSEFLPCEKYSLACIPRKTKCFQEVKPYAQIFDLIIKWYKYGEFDLKKEKLILQVKTIDKLFEYYCLFRMLKVLHNQGFELASDYSINLFEYDVYDIRYVNETDVANTYKLKKGDFNITLYYQPVIFSSKFQNGITLYKTTNNGYYIPDFLLKFSKDSDDKVNYAILDSKYSNRKSIKSNQYLEQEILKYYCQIAGQNSDSHVNFLWILQGRIDDERNAFYFNNSPIARVMHPMPSFGIYSLNTSNNDMLTLWEEILRCADLR